MRKKLFILFIFIGRIAAAQDFHFSQFYNSPIVLNPGEVGLLHEDYRVCTSYKDQWRSISNPFITEQFSYDMKIIRDKNYHSLLSGGISFFNDRAGTSQMGRWFIAGYAASSVLISPKGRLAFGLKTGYGSYSMKASALTWDNQWNSNTGFNENAGSGEPGSFIGKSTFKDFGAGTALHYVNSEHIKQDFGLSFEHFTMPQQTFITGISDKLKIRYTATYSAFIHKRNTNITYIPRLLIMKQGPNYEFMPGMMIRYGLGMDSHYTHANRSSAIYFGGFYRTRDALVLAMMFDHKHYFSFGLSYDVNISRLTPASSGIGGFEISFLHTGLIGRKSQTSSLVE